MSAEPTSLPPAAQVLQMIAGHWPARAVHVMATCGIADAMSAEWRDVAAIAIATGTHAPSLARLLRLLATLGVVERDGVVEPAGVTRYRLTALGATLRTDAPDSVRGAALLMGGDAHYTAWGALEHSIRTGEPALLRTAGATIFDWLATRPAERAVYNTWMTAATRMQLPALRAALRDAVRGCVVDVAGGSGGLLAGLLVDAPHARGILVDAQGDIALDAQFVALCASGRAERRRADIFTDMPRGGDVYLLKYLLHAIDDARAVEALRRCREAMATDGTIAIIEMLVPEDGTPHRATLMDLNMLVLTDGGCERTESEYRALCAKAGLWVCRVTATPTPLSVLEVRRSG